MKLSIIINFYNMRREAPRTLFSVSREYQKNVENLDYEVIAIDNGSTEKLTQQEVSKFGDNFHYRYYETTSPSPCKAINDAVKSAKGEYIICCIDGARVLSPGIIREMLEAAEANNKPFVYTLSMHLGEKLQNTAIADGYNQNKEDELLASINWRANGYELFSISCLAASAKDGAFSPVNETNCFMMQKDDYLKLGGYNESFKSKGGGLCNHDLFNRAHQDQEVTPIMLVGEATFHQYHGGVATNAKLSEHPWHKFDDEYKAIYGEHWEPQYRQPVYIGEIDERFIDITKLNKFQR